MVRRVTQRISVASVAHCLTFTHLEMPTTIRAAFAQHQGEAA